MYNVINYHVTDRCNYRCRYCFGKFGCECLALSDAKRAVDSVGEYFESQGIRDGRINLAGGEPLCYPWIDGLIEHIAKSGLKASIITNGSLLTPERIAVWGGTVCCIGLSIDSVSPGTNKMIGRSCGGRTLPAERAIQLCGEIRTAGIWLKINTVVSGYNLSEADALTEFYVRARPDRLKLFKMQRVRGVNDAAADKGVSDGEFSGFVRRVRADFPGVIAEGSGDMENSYLMIAPLGDVLLNDSGEYRKYGNVLDAPLWETVSKMPLSQERFTSRYKEQACPRRGKLSAERDIA